MSLQGQCWLIHSFSFACASIFYFTCILIRLKDVSLNCVVICRALIQYTHLFFKCPRCMIFIVATLNILIPHERPFLLNYHTNVILKVVV